MRLLTIIFLFFLTSCQGQTGDNSSATSTPFIPTDSSQFYFPLSVFQDSSSIGNDTFIDRWYSEYLFTMREPIIFMDKSQNEIYRFTWLRTFHNPVAIRIEKQGDTYLLFWKLCNGQGGYDPGQLTVNEQKTIDKATWDEFKNKLNQIDFWHLKTIEKVLGADGSQWVLEGKTPTQYHVVDRWAPNKKSNYYQCCDFLIGLTNLEVGDKY